MITSPYFSKRRLNGPSWGHELAAADIVLGQSSWHCQSTLERSWGLSQPVILGIRLYEYSFIRASNASNPMKGLP
jgi:hypothetical protein